MSENRLLRRTCVEREKAAGHRRILHNEQLHNFSVYQVLIGISN
jgi:hypothetical protein